MGFDPSSTSDIPMLVALIILFIGLYFRGLILWISLALALLYLYIFDRESIVTLVIYGFTASLLIAGYLRIKKGLKLTESRVCLLYTSPSPRDRQKSRMPSSA